MWPCKNISHIRVLVTNCFPTPPIKLKLGQRVEESLLIATHLDQSNYLANQNQGAVNKYVLTAFIRLWVMNSIPKTQSIPPKVDTNKSTFPLQFSSWKSTFFACNIVGWGTPSAKCTSMGALSSSKWSSILSALSRIMKLWQALVSKRHKTSRLAIFPFKKISRLHSSWARLALRASTLELPLPDLDLGQSLE